MSLPELNRHGLAIVIPITSKQRGYPSHIELDSELNTISYAQCELLGVVATHRFTRYLGVAKPVTLARIEQAVRYLLNL
jgi:mRNA-degrading endonuclease toxin of MazEF toxin-antitoxin module